MAQISFRVDDDVKMSAEQTLDTIGLSMSSVLNVFLKTIAREKRIPFELTADPFYSAANIERVKAAIADLEAGKGTAHELIEVEDE